MAIIRSAGFIVKYNYQNKKTHRKMGLFLYKFLTLGKKRPAKAGHFLSGPTKEGLSWNCDEAADGITERVCFVGLIPNTPSA